MATVFSTLFQPLFAVLYCYPPEAQFFHQRLLNYREHIQAVSLYYSISTIPPSAKLFVTVLQLPGNALSIPERKPNNVLRHYSSTILP